MQSPALAKGKSKGKGKPGGKPGGKVVRSNLTIADRKAKLAELKAKSRCLKCGIIGHWAGDPACKFRGKGSGAKGATIPATTGENAAPAAEPAAVKPQAYLATVDEDSKCEVVYLSNASAGRMEAYPAHLQNSPHEVGQVRER